MSGTNRLKTEEPRSKMTHVLDELLLHKYDHVENVRAVTFQIDV